MPNPALCLCATARLSQYLRQRQARDMAAAGVGQAATLQACTVAQWLGQLHEALALRGLAAAPVLHRVLMDAMQERLVWERVIRDELGDEAAGGLFDIAALAQTAIEADGLAVAWGVRPEGEPLSEESRRFLRWQQRFVQVCEAQGWTDAGRLHVALVDALAEMTPQLLPQLALPQRVAFAGFARLSPVEERLRQVLAAQGTDVGELPLGHPQPAAAPQAQSYPDAPAEALAAALWAHERLQQQPQGRFAIVVPDLAGQRDVLQDTLDDVLMPAALEPSQAEAPRPFNLSLGLPLSHFPVAATALSLLQLLAGAHRVEQAAFSALLRNPFWSAAGREGAARSLLEATLRTRLAPAAPLAEYVHHLSPQALQPSPRRPLPPPAPQLQQHLAALANAPAQLAGQRLPSQWAGLLLACLRRVGWLHERTLSSHEFQAREAFLQALDGLGRLDAFLHEVDLSDIVQQLRRSCQERMFQPKTDGQPRLQVLGVLETSGLDFDGVWVMGMVDTAWPPPARPNPLLPSALQRQAHSPHASAQVQRAFARSLHDMWLRSAPEVVFSWPRTAGAAELNPSPLVLPVAEEQRLPAPLSPHWVVQAAAAAGAALAEPLDDHLAPPVAEGERVRGGTGLLRAQAVCPAWAYFQYRLGAGHLEEPTDGLDARQRGQLLHCALEHFWRSAKHSAALQAQTAPQRQAAVNAAVDHALQAHDSDPDNTPLPPRFRGLERQRLAQLVAGWLQVETQREHGFTVLYAEREVPLDIEGLQGRMVIDRIDRLDDGSLLVVDYKTGAKIDTHNWASDRLTEPQLPLYAAIHPPTEGPVAGVVFAKVLLKDPTWAGLAQHDKLLPKVTGLDSKKGQKLFPPDRFANWDSVLQHWATRLRAVAQEIRTGDAGVRLADPKALSYCDVLPLLRLAEREAQMEAPPPASTEAQP